MNEVKLWKVATMILGGMVLALGGCNQFLNGPGELFLSAIVFVAGVVIALVGLTLFVFHR